MINTRFLNGVDFDILIEIVKYLLLKLYPSIIMIDLLLLLLHYLHFLLLLNFAIIVLPCLFITFYVSLSHHLISILLVQISPIVPFIIRTTRHLQLKHPFEHFVLIIGFIYIHVTNIDVLSTLFTTGFSKNVRIIVSTLRL